MNRIVKAVLALVVVAAVALGGFAVFEYFDRHEKVKDAGRACGELLTPPAGVTVPVDLGFSLPSGQTLLDVTTQGKTVAVTVYVKGGRSDLVSLRDGAVEAFKTQGFTASATDQEPTYEAEGQFSGKLSGTINVQPLCQGYDKIRYKFNT